MPFFLEIWQSLFLKSADFVEYFVCESFCLSAYHSVRLFPPVFEQSTPVMVQLEAKHIT
jgi:hypothetical protein